jgi:DNA-binding response OmpR family regulator
VDDEPDVVAFVSAVLKAEQFEVVAAYDGIGALDLAETEKPDLILLDIMMPMMSGYEVAEQLKANPQTKDIPILCLSSAHTPHARATSMKAGAVMLLVKPFMPAELVAQVRRYLPQASAQE